jgi:D-glycero-alpha-D-manno-heptose-7-phosphate kinase
MRTLVARAPVRIDFGGGWTDVPPYSEEEGGVVCNLAIARYAKVRIADEYGAVVEPPERPSGAAGGEAHPALVTAALRRFSLPGVRVVLTSDFPVGAGLGGSSAAGVAVVGALARWTGRADSFEQLAEESRAIEVEDLQVAGGRQDHYAAALGGALCLRFDARKTHVRRLLLTAEQRAELRDRLVVVYTGQSRLSATTVSAVLDAYRARDRQVLTALGRMRHIAEEQAKALGAGDFDALGELVGEHWEYQRQLHPAITTPRIDAIARAARDAGALGVKALGASGGGCVLAVARAGARERVEQAVAQLGDLLAFDLAAGGFEVLEEAEVTTR